MALRTVVTICKYLEANKRAATSAHAQYLSYETLPGEEELGFFQCVPALDAADVEVKINQHL